MHIETEERNILVTHTVVVQNFYFYSTIGSYDVLVTPTYAWKKHVMEL